MQRQRLYIKEGKSAVDSRDHINKNVTASHNFVERRDIKEESVLQITAFIYRHSTVKKT